MESPAALPVFQKQGSGHFINISSVAGLKVFSPGGTVYSGTKFAVAAISEGLRHEVGDRFSHDRHHARRHRHGIEVGHVGPGEPKFVNAFYRAGDPAESIARAIAYAIEQPANVDVNQIVIRPTAQEF